MNAETVIHILNHYYAILLNILLSGERLLTFFNTRDRVRPSKYTNPRETSLTPTRPCFLHRVVPMPRCRVGRAPIRGCSSIGLRYLTVGLV